MIFIFSKSKFEGTTDDVIDWLRYFGANYERINGVDYFKKIFFVEGEKDDLIGNINQAKVCWFRRWIDDDFFSGLLKDADLSVENWKLLENHLHREFNLLSNELWRKLKEKHWVTKPSEISTKKLEVIEIANKHGILVPRTLVTTSKKELVEFKRVNGRVITKTVGDVPNFRNDGKFYSMRTEEISDDFLNNDVPDFFFPSLFQALIEKEIELRIFFLFDRFFSMAIFSQSNKDTELDFRNYDYKKPNRMTPFRLPIWLEHKLKLLTSSLKLTTGSIDIIKEKATGSYYLLEINPVGQFGMTSHPCNYYLERELAKQLIRYDE